MNNAEIEATIHVCDMAGELIDRIGDLVISREMSMSKDTYKALLGDGSANVRVGLSEKMGGPYGYSSVRLDVSVSIRCDQSSDAISAAQTAAYNECLAFMDNHLTNTYALLKDHLEKNYTEK